MWGIKSRPDPAHTRVPDYIVFDTIVGNHYAHYKNYSLLYGQLGQPPMLTPLYDMLRKVTYPRLTPKMAMKVGTKYKFHRVMSRYWKQFADATEWA